MAPDQPKRKRGRPKKPLEMRVVKRDVKIPPEVYDAYCLRARRLGQSVHKVMVDALKEHAQR